MTTTAYPASPAQQSYLADLIAKRVVPVALAESIKSAGMLSSRQASSYIDLLKTLPWKPKTSENVQFEDYNTALEAVPNGSYALPTADLRTAFPALAMSGDYLFIEVKS